MRIADGHLDIAMTRDALQREDVPVLHHVVAGERVPQDMSQLPWSLKPIELIDFANAPRRGLNRGPNPGIATASAVSSTSFGIGTDRASRSLHRHSESSPCHPPTLPTVELLRPLRLARISHRARWCISRFTGVSAQWHYAENKSVPFSVL